MKWREVAEDEIKDAILYPKDIEDSIKGRKNAFKHVGNKWLKVTFKQEDDRIIVITVIDKDK
ncbi:MAG: hypothetical protein HY739_06805 [Desulfobacterales bacterium]|nr:hypothetical protein [Desulfobacterales bacterium]